jgi:bacterioferritin-associated ferredoxin
MAPRLAVLDEVAATGVVPDRSHSAPASAEEFACRCLQVTFAQLDSAVDCGQADSVHALIRATGAGTGCTACHRRIRHWLAARA